MASQIWGEFPPPNPKKMGGGGGKNQILKNRGKSGDHKFVQWVMNECQGSMNVCCQKSMIVCLQA